MSRPSKKFKVDNNKIRSFGQGGNSSDIDEKYLNATGMNQFIARGSLPPELLPITGKGGLGDIAHQVQKDKMMRNLFNNDVDTQVMFQILDPSTQKPKTNSIVQFHGKTYKSNGQGVIRVTDDGVIAFRRKIAQYRQKRVDHILDILEKDQDDEVPVYLFGIDMEDWKRITAASDTPKKYPLATDYSQDDPSSEVWMQKELNNVDCSLRMMKTYGMATDKYRLAVQKLTMICEYFEPNVQTDEFTNADEFRDNMKSGKNVLPDSHDDIVTEVNIAVAEGGKPNK